MKYLMLLVGFVFTSSALGTDLPPLGQRSYILNPPKEDEAGRIAVVPSNEINQTMNQPLGRSSYMRDPTYEQVAKEEIKKPTKIVKAKKLKQRSTSLKFRAFAIKGRLTEPRVRFTRPLLPIGRSMETFKTEFDPRLSQDTANQLDSLAYPN